MAASPAAMRENPGAEALRMSRQLGALAEAGDWTEVECLLARLQSAVMQVPESERRNVLVAVKRATDDVAAKARSAKSDVTDKLAALRLGQKAAKAYEMR